MNVLITGGASLLGTALARRLAAQGVAGRSVERITLLDRAAPVQPIDDPRVSHVEADINDPTALKRAIDEHTGTIVHLAAVVSGQAEADFDLGMRVDVDATRLILERARALGTRPHVVFTSSVAAFGGPLPTRVADAREPCRRTPTACRR